MADFEVNLCAAVPVVLPFEHVLFDEQRRILFLALNDLLKYSESFRVSLPSIKTTFPVVIELFDSPEPIKGFCQVWHPKWQCSYKFLCFTAHATVDMQQEFDLGTERSALIQMDDMERNLVFIGFADEFASEICHLLTATTIALPGALKTADPTVIVNGNLHRELPMLDGWFDHAIERIRKDGWPPIREIAVVTAWDWFSRLPGLDTGFVSGPVGRAISALTHIIYPSSPFDDLGTGLLWALLGLEAVYGRGPTSIGEQLREKSELLLGKSRNTKRRFATAYNFRSRFVHGDLDIPFRYLDDVPHEDTVRMQNTEWDASFFMQAVLISTIQELVLRNVHHVAFPYVLSTT